MALATLRDKIGAARASIALTSAKLKTKAMLKLGLVQLGIDIYNGNSDAYDMAQVAREGVTFVIHKASQGNDELTGPGGVGDGGWQDWKFVGAILRARAAGIAVVGGYHWLLRGNGAAQARTFIRSLQRVGGPAGVLALIDVEENGWDQTLNGDAATLADFLAEWNRLTNNQPIFIYSAEWYWGPYMGEPRQFAGYPLWNALYYQRSYPSPLAQAAGDVTPGYFLPFGGWTKYTMRQWSSNVIVAGQQSDVDYFPGTIAQLQAFTVPAAPAPKPGPTPAPPPKPNPSPNVVPPAPPVKPNVKVIQAAVHAVEDGAFGPDTDRRCELVRHKGPSVAALQAVLGVTADNVWGPATQAAYTTAVKGVQLGLGVAADGVWGPATDAAYLAANPLR